MYPCFSASTSTPSTTRTGSRCRPVSARRSPATSFSRAAWTSASTCTPARTGTTSSTARLAPLDPFSKEARELKRFFFSAASDAELDKQGRVLVPPALHRRARLGREVVVTGVYDHLEIWDRAAWADQAPRSKGAQTMLPNVLPESRLITSPCSPRRCAPLLAVRPGETVVDATFGAGGHSTPARVGSRRRRQADRDRPRSVRAGVLRPLQAGKTVHARFLRGEFSIVLGQLAANDVQADAILLDLGVSSMQLDRPERGFSYAADAPLDMRMDTAAELSARELVNEADERELALIFRRYGEERYARQIARAIVRRRGEQPFERTTDLVETIKQAIPDAGALRRGPSRPSASSRRCGSRSTTSSARSKQRCRRRCGCSGRAAASPSSASTRSRTGSSSGTSASRRAAARARRSSRSASAATSRCCAS